MQIINLMKWDFETYRHFVKNKIDKNVKQVLQNCFLVIKIGLGVESK